MPYDSAIPLLGIYPEKTKIPKDTCAPIFTATLFAIGKTLKRNRSLCTESHSREAAPEVVCVHVPGEPMCAAGGSVATAETLHLKGERQRSSRKEDSAGLSQHLK